MPSAHLVRDEDAAGPATRGTVTGQVNFDLLFDFLIGHPDLHARGSAGYELAGAVARDLLLASAFASPEPDPVTFGPFGSITLPYHRMGAIDSLDLFGLDELILFAFYWANRRRYRKVVDIGANLGLHTILLSRCGFDVAAYEPDPVHFEILQRNLALNGLTPELAVRAAVSDRAGVMEFVRVVGNTTGSHLAGAKPNPYGALERFPVDVRAFADIVEGADLVKIDAEGHEPTILRSVPTAVWERCDAVLEVGTIENAREIYELLTRGGINLFSQKTGWNRVRGFEDMPVGHREGSLFVSGSGGAEMPWG